MDTQKTISSILNTPSSRGVTLRFKEDVFTGLNTLRGVVVTNRNITISKEDMGIMFQAYMNQTWGNVDRSITVYGLNHAPDYTLAFILESVESVEIL